MVWYTLKRLGLMVPTLLVISLLAFSLNQCTPGDAVAEKIPSTENLRDPLAAYLTYQDNYRRLAQQSGTDQPLFYWHISSAAYPDTLLRVIPLAKRQNAERLIGLYGNWPAIQAYLNQLEQTIRQVLRLKGTHPSDPLIETERRLQQLVNQHDAPLIQQYLASMAQQLLLDSVLQQMLAPAVADLTTRYQYLTQHPLPYRHYLPTLRWNGKHNQYHHWLGQVLEGDLGTSLVSAQDVGEKISKALSWTLRLNGMAILLAYLLAIPLGVYSALHAGSRFDRWLSLGLFLLFALPSFWVATMLSKFLTSPDWFNIFPSMGVGEVNPTSSWWTVLSVRFQHFFMPVVCVTYGALAYITRQVRNSMLGILQSDYIRTARAKGLSERQVIWKHAFPNALFPLITMFGSILPSAIAGALIVELIFNIPGIGKLTIDSIYTKDWPIVYALLLLTAIMTVVGILLADLLYAWADPRVQLAGTKTTNHG